MSKNSKAVSVFALILFVSAALAQVAEPTSVAVPETTDARGDTIAVDPSSLYAEAETDEIVEPDGITIDPRERPMEPMAPEGLEIGKAGEYSYFSSDAVGIGTGAVEPGSQLEIYSPTGTGTVDMLRLRSKHDTATNVYSLYFSPREVSYVIENGATGTNLTLSTKAVCGGSFNSGYGNILLMPHGNVGIGETSPAAKLDVNGDILLQYGVNADAIRDEDDMASNDADALATQQSIKAYVDAQVGATTDDQTLNEVYNEGGNVVTLDATGDIQFQNDETTPVQMLFLDESSGNVGIGTTTPATKLDVEGGIASYQSGGSFIYLNPGASGSAINYSGSLDINEVSGYPGGLGTSNRVLIDASGNVGIGSSSPDYKLDVEGDVAISGGLYDGATTGSADQVLTADGSGGMSWETPAAIPTDNVTGTGTANYVAKFTSTGSVIGNSSIFDDGTNVGIGTASPLEKIHINGDVLMKSNTGTRTLTITMEAVTAGNVNLDLKPNSTSDQLAHIKSTYGFQFETNTSGTAVDALRITPAGNVGIGTTGPLSKLSVGGVGNALNVSSFHGTSNADNSKAIYATQAAPGAAASHSYAIYGNAQLEHIGSSAGYAKGVYGRAVKSDASDGTVGNGRAYGVYGVAGNSTHGYNYGVYGLLTGSINGAAIYGALDGASDEGAGLKNDQYAGYFRGNVGIGGLATAPELRLYEPSGSGVNYTGFKAQAQSANLTYTLPSAYPAASGYVLSSTTAGALSWAAPSGGSDSDWTLTHSYVYNTDQNVGIGTSSPMVRTQINQSTGQSLLLVRDDTAIYTGDQLGGIGFDGRDGNVPDDIRESSASIIAFASETHSTSDKGGYLTFWTSPTNQDDDTDGLERMRIEENGNVGIGATNPSSKLEIRNNSSTTTSNTNTFSNFGLVIHNDNATENAFAGIAFKSNTTDPSADTDRIGAAIKAVRHVDNSSNTSYDRTDLRFCVNNYYSDDLFERMTIKYDGNVGIGTTSPNQQLEITKNFRLPTTTSTTGIIYSATSTLLHTYGGSYSTFLGRNAGNLSMTGTYNTGVGYNALYKNTSGSSNVGLGDYALTQNTTGTKNTALGSSALYTTTTASHNTAVGYLALRDNTASYNTAVGCAALNNNTTGYSNVSVGDYSMNVSTTGNYNVAVGSSSLLRNTSGYQNVAVGVWSLENITTGRQNTAVGSSAGPSYSYYYNNTSIGYNASRNAYNSVRIGNTSVSGIGGQVAWSNWSDGRYKINVTEDVPGLDFITKLRPITFSWDLDALNKAIYGDADTIDSEGKYDIEKIKWTGFIAQEVDSVAKLCNYDFSGVDKTSDVLGLRYAEFVVPLVKAVKELKEENDELRVNDERQQAEIERQQAEIELLNGEINALKTLEARIEALENK